MNLNPKHAFEPVKISEKRRCDYDRGDLSCVYVCMCDCANEIHLLRLSECAAESETIVIDHCVDFDTLFTVDSIGRDFILARVNTQQPAAWIHHKIKPSDNSFEQLLVWLYLHI